MNSVNFKKFVKSLQVISAFTRPIAWEFLVLCFSKIAFEIYWPLDCNSSAGSILCELRQTDLSNHNKYVSGVLISHWIGCLTNEIKEGAISFSVKNLRKPFVLNDTLIGSNWSRVQLAQCKQKRVMEKRSFDYLEKFTFFIFEAIWSATYQFRECVSTFWFKSCNWRFLCCSFLFYVHRIQQSQVGRQILQLILVRYFSSRSDLTIFFRIMIPFGLYISFTSYEHPIRISNFCNEFLFTYFVSKYWQDKSFKLRPKYIKKCQYNSLHTKK